MAKHIYRPNSGLLFLALMVIALMPKQAAAAEIPKEFRGTWCTASSEIDGDWGAYNSETFECDGITIAIGAVELTSADKSLSCVVRSVKSFDVCPWGMIFKDRARARKKRPNQINPWSPGYQMAFECTDADKTSKVVAVDWVIEKGSIRGGLPSDYRCPWNRK